jgi:uncharacterized protein
MRHVISAAILLALTLGVAAQPHIKDPDLLTIDSKVLGEKRTAYVRVPSSYANGNSRYPLVVITDADAHMQHTAATIDFLVRNGRMPEVVLVGITNTDRTRDMTPTHVEKAVFDDGMALAFPTSGGADRFLTFIASELLPKVDSQYRTLSYRVFAGHSFGGLLALHALYTRPKLFNAWIAISPTLGWDDRLAVKRAAEFVESQKELDSILVVTVGNEGESLKRDFDALGKLFSEKAPKGFVYRSFYLEDDDHGSVVLPSHFNGLKAVFDGWRFTLDKHSDVATLWSAAQEHYATLSERIGATVRVPEAMTNMIGYRLLQAGKKDDAIAVFRANVEAYPKSANVHDSLGEAYEMSGDLENARTQYELAWKRGKEISDMNVKVYKANFDRVSKKHD